MNLRLLKESSPDWFIQKEFERYDTFKDLIEESQRGWVQEISDRLTRSWESGDLDKNKYYEELTRRSINGISYLEIIQKICQHYTFNDEQKNIKLYRGLHFSVSNLEDYDNIIKSKKIKTNKLSSFSESFQRAEVFSTYMMQEKGLVFSLEAPTRNILMTYKDWIHIQLEKEYVIINKTGKTYNIQIEATYGPHGYKEK